MAAKPQSDSFYFEGYDSPNYTPVPDQLLDEHLSLLSGAELKVVLYICRRTFGFKRESDNISLNQMLHGIVTHDGRRLDSGTGLSKPALINALKSLADKNILVAQQRSSAEKGNEPTNYRLNIRTPLGKKTELGESNNFTPLGKESLLGGVKKIDQGLGKKSLLGLGKKSLPTINSSTTNSVTINSSNNNNNSATDDPSLHKDAVVVVLTSLGIGKKVAQKLVDEHTEEYVREKIEFLAFLQAERPEEVQKPAGWLRKAIEDNYGPPDGFVSQAERVRIEAEQAHIEQEELVRAQEAEVARQQEQAQKDDQARAYRGWLNHTYGTTPRDFAFWKQALPELELTFSLHKDLFQRYIELAEILKVTDEEVLLGFKNEYLANHLTHPGTKKLIERTLSSVVGRKVQVCYEIIPAPEFAPHG